MFCIAGLVRADVLVPPFEFVVTMPVTAEDSPECIATTLTPPCGNGSVVTIHVSVPKVTEMIK